MSDLLMNQRETLKWAERLASDDWGSQVWESLGLGVGCGLLWLFGLFVLMTCLVPPMRRKVHAWTNIYLPWNSCVGIFLLQGIAGIMGHPALFSVGVLAYWINSAIPVWLLEPIAEFSNRLTVIGWLTWA
ncbi:hypothetical protein [Pleionea litopenaei]|uniref:Uncharacterized protein n=1 Tax=Pleionea litopenaei TaxID=3070815 RepID=A0AA51X574_9GAMM|nr:hypothetical protein [Pleionea sp. HL-JVS1]WMS85612.1 hypothetical protein Q9312_10345 [Pleionea sp. HL-JVS1]